MSSEDISNGKLDLKTRLPSLKEIGIAVLDGGFATHIEDVLGHDIASSKLWSASLLESEIGSKAIVQTHLDFLRAGANIISTSSYQASKLAFKLAGKSGDLVDDLLIKSIELADKAINIHHTSCPNEPSPLLLLSLGPFGAALANGSEYSGSYIISSSSANTSQGNQVNTAELEDFHLERLEAVARVYSVWQKVDIIAFETIPRLDEAVAIRRALKRLYTKYSAKISYVSFVFSNGKNLPWKEDQDQGADEELQQMMEKVFKVDEQGMQSPFDGIGINCTKPLYLSNLVERMTAALQMCSYLQKPLLFLYPDGGFIWDGDERRWTDDHQPVSNTIPWSDTVLQAASKAKLYNSGFWSGCIVGGCCKATTSDIAALHAKIVARTCRAFPN